MVRDTPQKPEQIKHKYVAAHRVGHHGLDDFPVDH
jgi:hypothetical protein